MAEILEALQVKHFDRNAGVNLKLPKAICNMYFEGMDSKQIASVVETGFGCMVRRKEGCGCLVQKI